MRRIPWRTWRTVAAVALSCSLVGAAEAPSRTSGPKPPSPVKALQAAAKGFAKQKSYKVQLDVEGGYSTAADHAVGRRVVQESYSGDVYSGTMYLPAVKAYRTLKRGTIYLDGTWKDILSDQKSVKVVRLFRFPDVVLANALKHASRSGRWVEAPRPAEKKAPPAPAAGEAEAAGGAEAGPAEGGKAEAAPPQPAGRTAVGGPEDGKASAGSGAAGAIDPPRVVRVEAPPGEALSHILEVQNSNCFGGG